jgi:hypothetical protein
MVEIVRPGGSAMTPEQAIEARYHELVNKLFVMKPHFDSMKQTYEALVGALESNNRMTVVQMAVVFEPMLAFAFRLLETPLERQKQNRDKGLQGLIYDIEYCLKEAGKVQLEVGKLQEQVNEIERQRKAQQEGGQGGQ